MNLKSLTDKTLLQQTEILVKKERQLLSEILWHLHEIERRRLFSDLGYGSLYDYAMDQLKYSSDQAYRRINAMRLLREVPEISEKIEAGKITLSHLSMAQTLFRQEKNQEGLASREAKLEVLQKIESKSNREAQKVILAISSTPMQFQEKQRQVSAELCELNFFADEALLAKIQQLKGRLAHSHPNMKLSEMVNYLCDLGLAKLTIVPTKLKSSVAAPAVEAARESESPPEAEPISAPIKVNIKEPISAPIKVSAQQLRSYIPVPTRRQVWLRANHRCEKCRSTFALQLDHRKPVSMGGDSSSSNLRLLCRNCNQRAAIKSLGAEQIQRHLIPHAIHKIMLNQVGDL